MLDWFRTLLPKEDRSFDLFEQHAKLVVAGATSLRAALQEGAEGRQPLQTVSDRENDVDAVTREVLLAVRRSFVTPFDRSAITGLISSLDDLIDQMQKTCKAIILFIVTRFEPAMEPIADWIVRAADVIVEGISSSRRFRCCGPSARSPVHQTRTRDRFEMSHQIRPLDHFRGGPANYADPAPRGPCARHIPYSHRHTGECPPA